MTGLHNRPSSITLFTELGLLQVVDLPDLTHNRQTSLLWLRSADSKLQEAGAGAGPELPFGLRREGLSDFEARGDRRRGDFIPTVDGFGVSWDLLFSKEALKSFASSLPSTDSCSIRYSATWSNVSL